MTSTRSRRLEILALVALVSMPGVEAAAQIRSRSHMEAPPPRANGIPVSRPRSLYERKIAPKKRFNKNDLILILVEESGSASNNSTTNLRRKYDVNAEIAEWADLDLANLTLSPDSTALPSLDITSEKKLEGRGTTDRRERITFRIMSRVVDVRPNGNLVLEGRTTRRINDEESILTVFGEVDPEDINQQTKSVRSERIADMKLVYSGSGPVSRNLGRSFLSWALEWLWPF